MLEVVALISSDMGARQASSGHNVIVAGPSLHPAH